jgi:pimeloyl-ACP methyl ester carboxylesterase
MLETSTVFHRGHRLRVARLGSGVPIVLLHGYPDNLQIWCEVAPRLAESHQVIAFDWPGMGYSDPWPGGATPFHMAERLEALLDTCQIEKAIVAGIDMGGQPAVAFSIRHPERVHSLIVMNSLLQWDEETSWEIAFLRKYGLNRFALRALPSTVFNRAVRTSLPRGQFLDSSIRSDMWESFRQPRVRDFIIRMCAGYQGTLPLIAQQVASIRTPTLLLWGEKDKHFPVEHARRFQLAVPCAKLQIVPRAEHWMPLSAPDAVAGHMLDFVGNDGGRSQIS